MERQLLVASRAQPSNQPSPTVRVHSTMASEEPGPAAPRRCAHWIRRQERLCTSMVIQTGEHFCSQHTPEALALARERSYAAKDVVPSAPDAGQRRYRRLESTHLNSRVVAQRVEGTSSAAPRAPEASDASPAAATLPSWTYPQAPVHLDIGCARGRWVLELGLEPPEALSQLHVNHVAVEIRADLVADANRVAAEQGVYGTTAAYVAVDMANNTAHRRALLATLAPTLRVASVCFPDPYPPKRRDERGRTLTRQVRACPLANRCGKSPPKVPSSPPCASLLATHRL